MGIELSEKAILSVKLIKQDTCLKKKKKEGTAEEFFHNQIGFPKDKMGNALRDEVAI